MQAPNRRPSRKPVTICANCIYVVKVGRDGEPDVHKSFPQQWQCAAEVQINPVNGHERITYASDKNLGNCPDFSEK